MDIWKNHTRNYAISPPVTTHVRCITGKVSELSYISCCDMTVIITAIVVQYSNNLESDKRIPIKPRISKKGASRHQCRRELIF